MYSNTIYNRLDLDRHILVARSNLLLEALDQRNDVFLFQIPKHLDFTESSFLNDVVVVRLFEFLDRN